MKIMNKFLIMILVILILLCFNNFVNAFSVSTTTIDDLKLSTEAIPSEILAKIKTLPEYTSGDYYYFFNYMPDNSQNNGYNLRFVRKIDCTDSNPPVYTNRTFCMENYLDGISSSRNYMSWRLIFFPASLVLDSCVSYKYDISTNSVSDRVTSSNGNSFIFNISTLDLTSDGKANFYLYTNASIYKDRNCTDFFFHTEEYQIPMITETKQITGVMVEVLKMMIPIGLLVFGMVLLIFLIRWVISRVQ